MTEEEIRQIPVSGLKLPKRAARILADNNIATVGGIVDLFNSPERISEIPKFGYSSFYSILDAVSGFGVTLNGNPMTEAKSISAARRHRIKNPSKGPGISVWLTQSELLELRDLQAPQSVLSKIEAALSKLN